MNLVIHRQHKLILSIFFLLLFMASAVTAQPFPPINITVSSRAADNLIGWAHHPLNPAGYVVNYQICRSTTYGTTIPVATVAGNAVSFPDNTIGYSPDQEFYYTVRAIGNDALVSDHSEQVMRFLPRVGATNTELQINTVQNLNSVSWSPYPGQWTDVYTRIKTSPNPNTGVLENANYGQRQITRATRTYNLPVGGPYYFEVIIGAPDWWGSPANNRWVSYSTSLPFYINPTGYEDNASSTYFNSSPQRVMADPLPAGGVGIRNFSNNGGDFWRIRQPFRRQGTLDRLETPVITPVKLNAPCRIVVTGIPAGQIAAGRAASEVRVADEYGDELVSQVVSESVAAGWVNSFTVHFITSQDINAWENYWIYWGNPSATPPNYGIADFKHSFNRTSQFDYSLWYSRIILRGGTETFSTAAGNRLLGASPPVSDDFVSIQPLGAAHNFSFFDFSTNTINVSTNGYLSFSAHSLPMNTWAAFTGGGGDRFIAPFWCNLMINDSQPTNAGLYFQQLDTGSARRHRGMFTWVANRFNAPNEAYIAQATLFRAGDISLRYQTLNFNALYQTPSGSGDYPLNVAPHHTAGISANDGVRWLSITDDSAYPTTANAEVTPLRPDTGRNVIHHFQSCYSWNTAVFTDPTNLCAMAGPTTVAHYDSRIFDGRSTDPTWTNVEYEMTGSGQIDFYVRTSTTTTFPAWNATHLLASNLTAGDSVINLTLPSQRYLQYRLVFKKTNMTDNPVMNRVKFNVGYVIIDNTTNEFNAQDVSQGQTFLASMTYSNFYSNPVNTIAASLTFTPVAAMQTWTPVTPLPTGVLPNASTTIGYQVTVDDNSGNIDVNWTYIDGYLEAGDGLATLTSSAALSRSYYRIRRKADLAISLIDTPFDKVNKGQGGIPVQMLITNNAPQVPMILNGASLTFSLGNYTIDPEYAINPADEGLFGVYYNTTTNPPLFPQQGSYSRLDSNINFNWGAASPVPGVIGIDNFAIRWSGYVIPAFTETYIFYPFTDDGARLWVNGQLIVNNWTNTGATEKVSKPVNLTAGMPAEIILEMYERTGNARAELRWESPSTLKNIIPFSRFRPAYLPVVHGGQSILVNYTVAVQPTSPSGVAYINGTASGTNGWVPGMRTDSANALTIDSWIIQAPADLAVGQIKAPPLVYRGQANVPVEVEILNIGEADAIVASIPISFTLGSYTDIIPGEPMPVTISGGESRFIKVLVSILENTATGTSWIDAEVFGNDDNTGAAISAVGAAIPGQWTILAEKILTYKDASFLYPSTTFVRPDSGQTGIFALAENLVPLKEYAIRWYDTFNNEITTAATIGFSDPSGTLAAEWKILPAFEYGVYTVKITNPVNTYSPSQTSFRVVTSASVSAFLTLPEKVSIGQNFSGHMDITNIGGADATGMVPAPLTITGPGTANLLSGPTPASLEVPGGTTATITYNFNATGQGNFMLTAGASGFDGSSDAAISAATIDSNICIIQTPALTSITGLTATPTIVYRGQRGIEVLMTLHNTGQADALISLADLRLPPNNNLTQMTSSLASPTPLPFTLPGNSLATFTFRISINAGAAAGPTSITGRIQYRDANNPVSLFTVVNQLYTFTIETPTLQCYANNTFTTERYAFNDGADVFARASGLPTNTDVRIRFYETTEPYPPTGAGVAVLTPLNTGATGIVSHPGHTIPPGTDKLNQWLVIVDDGNDISVGNIFAMQFFDVYRLGSYSVSLNLDKNACFVGDIVNASFIVNNLATWPTNVRHNLNTFNQTYAPDSIGRLNRLSWSGGTLPFPSGASYTFNATFQADIDSGLNGSTTLRLPVNQWRVFDDSQSGASIWYGSITDAVSPLKIYRKGLRLQTLPLPATLPGLRGEYYNTVVAPTPMPTGDALATRIDSSVNFDWITASPVPGLINTDNFAARWSGFVTPQFSENYTFFTRTDDGTRLWVNGVQLVERWINQGATEVNGTISLTAGIPVPIVMEYFENTGNALAELRWQSPSTPKAIIPVGNLSHTPYDPPIWDFGLVDPGSSSVELQSQLTNTGNHKLENIKLAKVDLRKSATEIISGANLQTSPALPVELATSSTMNIFSSIQIPFHQPPGVYVATMAIYEDHNFSNTLEVTDTSKEPHNLVMARVEVKSVARAMMVNNSIYLGVVGQGMTSPEQTLEFVGVGNQNLTDLKFDDMSADGISITPINPGSLLFDGYGTASISVTIPLAQLPGVYFATGTLRDDIPGGATDQFLVKWEVGTQALQLNPGFFVLGAGTPTYQIPDYPSTITNTGELPLNRLHGISTVFENIQQPGSVATDNVSLSSPQKIEVLSTEPSPAVVYVPGGTATGTYIATFTWFEDLNNNSIFNSFEAHDTSIASFVVQSFYRLYSLKSTEDFGGVKPDTTKTINVGIRNAGSLIIPKVKFVISSLTDGFNTFDTANITVPASLNDVTAGELRYFNMNAFVPALQTHGVYTGSMIIYGDIDDNGIYDPLNEPGCEVLLRIEIGDQELSITTPAAVLLNGTAASTTSSVFITTQNTGSLALTRVKVQGTNLIPQVPGPIIASSTFQFLPSALVGSLVINQSRTFSTRVAVPFAQPSGIYEGTIWAWEDANNDGLRQPEETTASVPVTLTVTYIKMLQTSPGSLNLGMAARGDTASASFIAQNIGNTSLIDARWEKGILTGPTPIGAANTTITPDPIGSMATPPVGLPINEVSTLTLFIPTGTSDGAYSGTMVFYEDEFNPALNNYDAGVEPFFNFPVSIQIATPFISVTDPIVIPASNPVGQTASLTFTVSNTGSIAFKNLRYSVTNLVSGPNQILSANISILPATFSALVAGQTQNAEISAWLFPATSVLPGIYTGTLTVYDDRNFNGIRDGHESFASTFVSLTVNAYPALNIIPASVNAGKIARNTFSNPINITFQNTGNVPLAGLTWNKNDMFKDPGIFVPAASMAFTFLQPEPIAINAIATAQAVIGRIAPDQELGGPYGPAEQFLQSGAAIDSLFIECEIIPGGPQGLDKGSVWQEIATSSFPVAPATDHFILSAYVSPGSGSARIGFLLTDEIGNMTGFSGGSIDSAGNFVPVNSVGGVFESFKQDNGSGEILPWYRIYVRFNYGFSNSVASKTYILLQNTGPEGIGHSSWFDGIQLEKADNQMTGPTSYNDKKKLISPSMIKDLSGRKDYYQW